MRQQQRQQHRDSRLHPNSCFPCSTLALNHPSEYHDLTTTLHTAAFEHA